MGSCGAHPVPEQAKTAIRFVAQTRRDDVEHVTDLIGGRAGVERAAQVRVELAVVLAHRADGDDAQLAPSQIELGAAEDLAVAVDDHPGIEGRVELANVGAQALDVSPYTVAQVDSPRAYQARTRA